MAAVTRLSADLNTAAWSKVPVIITMHTDSGRTVALPLARVADVALDSAVVVARDGRRFVVRLDRVVAVHRGDGRPWQPHKSRDEDARAELRARAEQHQDVGGLPE